MFSSSSYGPAGPISARSENPDSSTSVDSLAIRPAVVNDLLRPSITFNSQATKSSLVSMLENAFVFYRGEFNRTTREVSPPLPTSGQFNFNGSSYTISATSVLSANVLDDGIVMSLGGESFSGIPSGPNVTITTQPNPSYTESNFLADGSWVYKTLSYTPNFPQASETSFFRRIIIALPSLGIVILNASATPFNPAAGQNATLNFDLIPTGSPRPSVNQWSVSVVQPNNTTNQPFYTFPSVAGAQGPGTSSSIPNGLRINVPWNGKNDAGQTISGDFSWVVGANVTVGTGTRQATLRLDQFEKALKLNASADPSNYDPQSGRNTTLTFDLEAQGLGASPNFEWNVAIKDSLGADLFVFTKAPGSEGPGNITAPSTITRRVKLGWNGLGSNGQPVPSDFKWVVSAIATRPIAGGGGDVLSATATVPNSLASLEIFDSVLLFSPIATSEDKRLVNQAADSIAKGLAEERLKTIFPAGGRQASGAQAGKVWHLKANNLAFSGTRPGTVKVTLEGEASKVPIEVSLVNSDPEHSSTWEGDVDIQARGLILPQDQLKKANLPIRTSYTIAASTELDILGNLETMLENLGNLATYPLPRLALGSLLGPLQLQGNLTQDRFAASTPANVRCFGFEPVQIKLNADNNTGLITTQPIQATVKVRNPASLAVFSVHGIHSGKLQFEDGPLTPEIDLQPSDTASLKTLMLLSCNVLDLHDYNNNLATEFPRTGTSDPVALRPSPGKLWRTATGGKTVLLGYNFPVYSLVGRDARANYFQKALPALEALGVATARREPLAWLKANYESALEGRDSSALNACAWDKDYYYFISFDPPYQLNEGHTRHTINGFYRVPLDSQGDNTQVNPSQSPPEGAEKLDIPGVEVP